MRHQYDWSKLDAGWRCKDGILTRVFDSAAIVVETLERWREGANEYPEWVEFKTAAKDQLRKCRITAEPLPPHGTYDWNRLGPYWWHDENKNALVYCSQDGKGDANYLVRDLEMNHPITDMDKRAKAELERCRTVALLQACNEYDWSRLEGSGWRHSDHHNYITNGTWSYWYAAGNHGRLETTCVFAVGDAFLVQEQASILVAKCKRDWRDEVEQACDGIDGLAELYLMGLSEYRLRAAESPHWFAISFKSDRTFGLIDGVQTLEWVLKLSIIIERLKKRGWREA